MKWKVTRVLECCPKNCYRLSRLNSFSRRLSVLSSQGWGSRNLYHHPPPFILNKIALSPLNHPDPCSLISPAGAAIGCMMAKYTEFSSVTVS